MFLVAILATALALGGALAHLYALPNKMALPREEYFVAQKAYLGWNRLAIVLLVQLAALIVLAVLRRAEPRVLRPILVAIAGLVAAQAVFWAWTYPANVATANWTTIPDDWAALRRQWEYSHAAGAAFQLVSLTALVVALLARTGRSS